MAGTDGAFAVATRRSMVRCTPHTLRFTLTAATRHQEAAPLRHPPAQTGRPSCCAAWRFLCVAEAARAVLAAGCPWFSCWGGRPAAVPRCSGLQLAVPAGHGCRPVCEVASGACCHCWGRVRCRRLMIVLVLQMTVQAQLWIAAPDQQRVTDVAGMSCCSDQAYKTLPCSPWQARMALGQRAAGCGGRCLPGWPAASGPQSARSAACRHKARQCQHGRPFRNAPRRHHMAASGSSWAIYGRCNAQQQQQPFAQSIYTVQTQAHPAYRAADMSAHQAWPAHRES